MRFNVTLGAPRHKHAATNVEAFFFSSDLCALATFQKQASTNASRDVDDRLTLL